MIPATEQVKESVHLLLRGCGCKKGCCNNTCSYFKAGVKCGPGCRFTNCENLPKSRNQPDDNGVEQVQDDVDLRLEDEGEETTSCTSDREENLSEDD